jgi:hypothetical protein
METGILYVVFNEWIRNPETNEKPYKIGITKNSVYDRYYGLGLKMPGKFETLFAYRLVNYKRAEQSIQEILYKFRINGEWFNISQEEIDLVENICKKMGGVLVTDEVKQEVEIETDEENEDDNDTIEYQNLSGGKDKTRYSFNGRMYGKGRLVLAVVEEYIRKHNNCTLAELQEIFPKELQKNYFVVDTLENAKNIIQESRRHQGRHFVENPIVLNNGEKVVVTTEWGIGNIDRFIAKAKDLGFNIEV